MPVKRRFNKGRSLDTDLIEDLFYGPGTCLFSGCGYLGQHGNSAWRDKSPEDQEAVLSAMRDDWERFHPSIMKAWDNRTAHDIDIAKRFHCNPAEPWAQTEFGEPK